MSTTYQPLPDTFRSRARLWGPPAPVDKTLTIHLLLRHNPQQERIPLTDLAHQISQTRQFLSHDQFARQYSCSPTDIAQVEAFAHNHNLTIIEANPLWRTVSLQGTIGDLNNAFQITIHQQKHKQFFPVYEGHLSLPTPLHEIVTWVWGLHKEIALLQQSQASIADGTLPCQYDLNQLAEIYNFPPHLDGQDVCVGVLSLYGGYKQSDMETFFTDLGLPLPRLVNVGPNRWVEGFDVWANFEVTMDVQITAALAPAATTAVYFSGATGYHDTSTWNYFKVINMALFDTINKPSVLTMSWGLPETLTGIWIKKEAELIDELFQIAAILGITVCLPTGDSGSIFPTGVSMFNAPTLTYFPASSPWVLSCGATTLYTHNNKIDKEIVWNRLAEHMRLVYSTDNDNHYSNIDGPLFNLGASSGGISIYFPRPAYQDNANVPPFEQIQFNDWIFAQGESFAGRGIPDVAAVGDFLTGYKIYIDGQWRSGGGTSASTPLWAGLLARLVQGTGQRLGFINPLLYHLQIDQNIDLLNPITEGHNGGFAASPHHRWNACTGLGTPHGQRLLDALQKHLPPPK
ncbi:MAG TPA: S53 family serine peptidase [Anaerolineae bacterium]|nr:S53 family serine peptidase [Anaerolineae bacterium]